MVLDWDLVSGRCLKIYLFCTLALSLDLSADRQVQGWEAKPIAQEHAWTHARLTPDHTAIQRQNRMYCTVVLHNLVISFCQPFSGPTLYSSTLTTPRLGPAACRDDSRFLFSPSLSLISITHTMSGPDRRPLSEGYVLPHPCLTLIHANPHTDALNRFRYPSPDRDLRPLLRRACTSPISPRLPPTMTPRIPLSSAAEEHARERRWSGWRCTSGERASSGSWAVQRTWGGRGRFISAERETGGGAPLQSQFQRSSKQPVLKG